MRACPTGSHIARTCGFPCPVCWRSTCLCPCSILQVGVHFNVALNGAMAGVLDQKLSLSDCQSGMDFYQHNSP